MLIEVKNELHKRKVSAEGLCIDYADLTALFKDSTSKVIRGSLDKGGVVLAAELTGFAGLLKGKLGPELAQYARAIAGVKGIFHSDELPAYGITAEEVLEVSINLGLKEGDAFVLVAEKESVAHAALNAVLERARISLKGVPKETRRATPEGTSEFMRPLPGSARMYPETDEPLVVIGEKYLKQVEGSLSALPEEKLEEFISLGLSRELAGQLVKSRWVLRFEEFMNRFPEVKPSVIATMLISMPKEVRKRFNVDIEGLGEDKYAEVLCCLDEKKISRDAVPEILAELGRNPVSSVKDIINSKGFSLLSEDELGLIVDKVIKENPGKPEGMIIGRVMAEVRGKADADSVKAALGKRLGLGR
jgi:glutamyl-tRNA(Gln) amidotransferase subunit E